MKSRATAARWIAALAALFLAPLAEASLTRSTSPTIEQKTPALALPSPTSEPSGFSLFDGNELASAAAESESAESFHPLAAVSLLSKDGAEAPLVSAEELIYPKTRYRVFGLLGTPILGELRGVSLELHWRSASFSCGLASGTVGWLSQDPLGDRDSPNLYGFVGGRPHEATDPMGLCLGLDNVPCWDYATELVKVPFYNARDIVVQAGKGAAAVVDMASGGRISAAVKAYDAIQATSGPADAKLAAAATAYSRQQESVMTLGFSEAPNKLQHAKDLVGAGGIDRGTARLFNGIVDGDFDEAGRGFAEAAGGTGQLAGTVAAAYAPFAPRPAPLLEPPPVAPSIGPTVGDLRAAGLKDAHHIIQDAAVRELPGYETNAAPGTQLPGPSTRVGTAHYRATQIQRQAGGGTYAAERRIGYKALRTAGLSEAEARAALARADAFFKALGVDLDTILRTPGNRR